MPTWNRLGKNYKDNESVAIAKMDGTENELEEVEMKGFPTIKLYRKGTNQLVDFTSSKCELFMQLAKADATADARQHS